MDAYEAARRRIDTTPEIVRPNADRIEAAAQEIPTIFENMRPNSGPAGGSERVAFELARRIQAAGHTLAAAQWAIHNFVVRGHLEVDIIPRYGMRPVPGVQTKLYGGGPIRQIRWENVDGFDVIPEGRPTPYENFCVRPTAELWAWWSRDEAQSRVPNVRSLTAGGGLSTLIELRAEAKRRLKTALNAGGSSLVLGPQWKWARDTAFRAILRLGGVKFEQPKCPSPMQGDIVNALQRVVRWCESDDARRLEESQQPAEVPIDDADSQGKQTQRRHKSRMSLREANVAARPILESYVKEKQCLPPQRWLADQVGCGNGQVCKLPCYIAVREQLGGGKKVKRPKRITLTSRVEASTGKLDDDLERLKSPDDDTLDGDGALERLLAEQCQDDEGSPVDPQFKPPKRLHRRV